MSLDICLIVLERERGGGQRLQLLVGLDYHRSRYVDENTDLQATVRSEKSKELYRDWRDGPSRDPRRDIAILLINPQTDEYRSEERVNIPYQVPSQRLPLP